MRLRTARTNRTDSTFKFNSLGIIINKTWASVSFEYMSEPALYCFDLNKKVESILLLFYSVFLST